MIKRFTNTLSGIPNSSPEYHMEGYAYEEGRPKRFEGKGKDKMEATVSELIERGLLLKETGSSGGCPIANRFTTARGSLSYHHPWAATYICALGIADDNTWLWLKKVQTIICGSQFSRW